MANSLVAFAFLKFNLSIYLFIYSFSFSFFGCTPFFHYYLLFWGPVNPHPLNFPTHLPRCWQGVYTSTRPHTPSGGHVHPYTPPHASRGACTHLHAPSSEFGACTFPPRPPHDDLGRVGSHTLPHAPGLACRRVHPSCRPGGGGVCTNPYECTHPL